MLKTIRRVLVCSLLLVVGGCVSLPSGQRVPLEERDVQQETSGGPRPEAGVPLESRLPEPATEIEALPPPQTQTMPTEPPVQAPAAPRERPQASSAVVALLETAREQAAAGQDEQAAANLERALRIEPKNPWLWHRLGVLRLQQGNYQAAIELANKSNALAAGNRRLMAGNWELLARAYSALGREEEAERARRNARELQPPQRG